MENMAGIAWELGDDLKNWMVIWISWLDRLEHLNGQTGQQKWYFLHSKWHLTIKHGHHSNKAGAWSGKYTLPDHVILFESQQGQNGDGTMGG